jgi:hypothetical protein
VKQPFPHLAEALWGPRVESLSAPWVSSRCPYRQFVLEKSSFGTPAESKTVFPF